MEITTKRSVRQKPVVLKPDGNQKVKLNRRSLSTLQLTANNQTMLIGSDGLMRLAPQSNNKKRKAPEAKHADTPNKQSRSSSPSPNNRADHSGSGSKQDLDDANKEAWDWMCSKEPPETYWKELAEQRRVALDEALMENEQLHTEVDRLKEENEAMKVMVKEAEKLADIVQSLTEEESSSPDGNDDTNGT